MALFKIYRGLEANLPTEMHDGYAYFCSDSAAFFIDFLDYDGNLQRKQLNAKDAETLSGASLATILQSSEVEIPTSKAVFDALKSKQNELTFDETPTADSANPVTSGGVYAARSDWNQNDETAPDYVKNRTHYYSEHVLGAFLDEQSLTTIVPDGYPCAAVSLFDIKNYVSGVDPDTIMVVNFDGVKYECRSFESGALYYGNVTIVGAEPIVDLPNNEPFLVEINGSAINMYTSEAGTYTVSIIYVNKELVQLDEKYIPDTIARTDDIVQSDWSVNDETNSAFVKNRTHWTEYGSVIAPEQSVDNAEYFNGYITSNDIIELNKTYDVVIDGVSYILSPVQTSGGDFGSCIMLGNPKVASSDYAKYNNGYDFCFMVDDTSICVCFNDAEAHTFSITEYFIHQIDKKYIPDQIFYAIPDVTTLEEIDKAVNNGLIVYCKINNNTYLPLVSHIPNYMCNFAISMHTDSMVAQCSIQADGSSKWIPIPGGLQSKLTGTAGQMVGFDSRGNAIAQDMPSSIPEVTTSDNGKFLRVVDGAPAWATVQSAEEVLF